MAKVEVSIMVIVTEDGGAKEQHSLSGVIKDSKNPTQATAVIGIKVLKQLLAEMREKS